jgi:16S rRNA (guanine966-N2)-methyltransferase
LKRKNMRIVAGRYKGRRLVAPRGRDVRPTADKVKEAIFSILGDRVNGARVLDLFAGSGALALEAISRGAAEAVLVDCHAPALAAIRKNLESLGLERVSVIHHDMTRGPGRLLTEPPFDLIFIDPPYRKGLASQALGIVSAHHLAQEEALAVLEHAADETIQSAPWETVKVRRYGKTTVSFLFHPVT